MFTKCKTCIPPEPAIVLGNFREPNLKKVHKQHEIDIANAYQSRMCPKQTIFHKFTLGLALGLALGIIGIIGLLWALLARVWSCVGSAMTTQ